jgi:hypothetical protein
MESPQQEKIERNAGGKPHSEEKTSEHELLHGAGATKQIRLADLRQCADSSVSSVSSVRVLDLMMKVDDW